MDVMHVGDVDTRFATGVAAAARLWWVFLAIGIGWLLFAIIVLRFTWTSVSAISLLFGIVMIAAALDEVLTAFAAPSGWSTLGHVLLGGALAVIGIVAFVHPGDTFAALAAVMSFYFVIQGAVTASLALLARAATSTWWLLLLLGLAEVLLGFWAAGDFGHRAVLLVVWVGVTALTRGIGALVFAFQVRDLHEDTEAARFAA
jgi:uncharacterized membrane protein HdeD (DUF308 family)